MPAVPPAPANPTSPVASEPVDDTSPAVEEHPADDVGDDSHRGDAAEPLPQVHPETENRAAVAAVRQATIEDLFGKTKKTDQVFIPQEGANGENVRLQIDLEAVDGPTWDHLVDLHPPKTEHSRKGLSWNPDTFPAALLERTVVSPRLSFDQWQSIKDLPNWSSGEYGQLFNAALGIAQSGFTVPFTGLG